MYFLLQGKHDQAKKCSSSCPREKSVSGRPSFLSPFSFFSERSLFFVRHARKDNRTKCVNGISLLTICVPVYLYLYGFSGLGNALAMLVLVRTTTKRDTEFTSLPLL